MTEIGHKIHKMIFLRRLRQETDRERRGEIIYKELKLKGYYYIKLGDILNTTPDSVREALMSCRKSERIHTFIANLLDVEKSDLWPDCYPSSCDRAA
ncbi:MAG: hypothetical protein ABSG42_00495 [Nitrospirota bacterium]